MKLFILTAVLSLGLNAMAAVPATPAVNEKVMKTFNQVFAGARDVQWNATAGYSEASFRSGAIATRAVIDNSGALIRTIRYYGQNELPSNVLYKIRKQYDGKAIFGVTEVTNTAGTLYHVVIKDSRNLFNVTVDNNGSVLKTVKYKRGDL
ncbi:hypothetical protein [Niabella drilacis]|uniref:Beta-lactamase-inhibitor-like, PepSY-like n=1 Tax=Niabella drilacis (strain DSM 25811 / CCM 8410 / CCUG 62505 / LMG 26954 / E90) TaxID=1285928 RepID=A0A1G7AES8_NIADE|nr:hypothetical protein [Niabella drilacis]SDE12376.1 hypothetical protein SAMN04487894_12240 [Niabella drilacis]